MAFRAYSRLWSLDFQGVMGASSSHGQCCPEVCVPNTMYLAFPERSKIFKHFSKRERERERDRERALPQIGYMSPFIQLLDPNGYY